MQYLSGLNITGGWLSVGGSFAHSLAVCQSLSGSHDAAPVELPAWSFSHDLAVSTRSSSLVRPIGSACHLPTTVFFSRRLANYS